MRRDVLGLCVLLLPACDSAGPVLEDDPPGVEATEPPGEEDTDDPGEENDAGEEDPTGDDTSDEDTSSGDGDGGASEDDTAGDGAGDDTTEDADDAAEDEVEAPDPVQVNEDAEGARIVNVQYNACDFEGAVLGPSGTCTRGNGDDNTLHFVVQEPALADSIARDGLVLVYLESGVPRGTPVGVYPDNLQFIGQTDETALELTRPQKPVTLLITQQYEAGTLRIDYESESFFNPTQWVDDPTTLTLVLVYPHALPPAGLDTTSFSAVAAHYDLVK